METPTYDDPEAERLWCDHQRHQVTEYLRTQGVAHGRVGDWPAWHVAPYVSIWAIESLIRPEWIGWWATPRLRSATPHERPGEEDQHADQAQQQ
jgi:hypothetical protein